MTRWLFCILLVLFPCIVANAANLEYADYTTPDWWSEHIAVRNPEGSGPGLGLFGGTLKSSVKTKYRLRSNEYAHDQDFYQYLRTRLNGATLGDGSVSGGIFFRVAKDIDGNNGNDWSSNNFYYYTDAIDAQEHDQDWSTRLYYGYLKFSDVIEGTELTLGRTYVDHLQSFKLDGADLQVDISEDFFKVFAYAGVPVSHYVDTDGDYIAGGGVVLQLTDNLKVRTEYTASDALDVKANAFKIRADQSYDLGLLFGEYTNIEGANHYKLGTITRYAPTKTTISFSFEQMLNAFASGDASFVLSPLTAPLSPYNEYVKARLKVQQGITEHVLTGLGFEQKDCTGSESGSNRDYIRLFANIDLIGLVSEDTYISLNADYWNVDDSNKQIVFGGQVSYVLSEQTDIWLGTSFERYQYDADTNSLRDWVRTYYLGGARRFSERASATLDLSYEDSEILGRDADDFADSLAIELLISFAF